MGTENTNTPPQVETTTIENIDDFLPLPGAESVVTSDEDSKQSLFTSPNKPVDMSFMEEDKIKESEETIDTIAELDKPFTGEEAPDIIDEKKKPGRKATDKSGLVEFLKKRIENNEMFAFDDYDDTKQSLDDYLSGLSDKDVEELWTANMDNVRNEVAANTPKEFFESLPEELQYAAEYVAKGGQDLKGLFRALAHVEEIRDLNPADPDHQEAIVRQYLQATGFGNGDQDLIEDQIQEWVDGGNITKKATQFKPKLDDLQSEMLQAKLAQQENFKLQQQQKKEAYMHNIYETLKPGELNGIKIDNKRQKFLWDELTTVKYESITGRPTNMLGKLLEEYQFGKEPRYDLIAETLWLLSDPDDYKENIRKNVKTEVIAETVRALKTEQNRKISSTVMNDDDEDDKPKSRKIPRQGNIFRRQ